MMLRLFVLLSCLGLGACSSNSAKFSNVTKPSIPTETVSKKVVKNVSEFSSSPVVVPGPVLAASQPFAVSINDQPICAAANIILGDSLGLGVSCSGLGTVSINLPELPPEDVYRSFVAVSRTIGVSVGVTGSSVVVSGGAGDDAQVQYGGDIQGLESVPVDGVNANITRGVPRGFEKRVRDHKLRTATTLVRDFGRGIDVSEIEALVTELSLDVDAATVDGSTLVMGPASDVSVIQKLVDGSENPVVTLEVSAMSETTLETLIKIFPTLSISHDPDNSTLFVTGSRIDLARYLGDIRAVLRPPRDVRLAAVFVSYQTVKSYDLQSALGFGVRSSDGSLAVGSLPSGSNFNFNLSEVVSEGLAAVVSRPTLVTTTGKPARFVSGSSVPVVSVQDDEGESDVVYREAGIIVAATPTMLPSGRISISLSVSVSTVSGVGVTGSPTFDTRSIQTVVELASGDTISLSGLDTTSRVRKDGKETFAPNRTKEDATESLAFFLSVDWVN